MLAQPHAALSVEIIGYRRMLLLLNRSWNFNAKLVSEKGTITVLGSTTDGEVAPPKQGDRGQPPTLIMEHSLYGSATRPRGISNRVSED